MMITHKTYSDLLSNIRFTQSMVLIVATIITIILLAILVFEISDIEFRKIDGKKGVALRKTIRMILLSISMLMTIIVGINYTPSTDKIEQLETYLDKPITYHIDEINKPFHKTNTTIIVELNEEWYWYESRWFKKPNIIKTTKSLQNICVINNDDNKVVTYSSDCQERDKKDQKRNCHPTINIDGKTIDAGSKDNIGNYLVINNKENGTYDYQDYQTFNDLFISKRMKDQPIDKCQFSHTKKE